MRQKPDLFKHIINFFKGIALGVATLIPGVSGGTMAIVLNIYDKLLKAVSSFFKNVKENLLLLGIVGLGAAAGFLLLSNVIKIGLEVLRYPMTYLFVGIIAGGLPVLYKSGGFKRLYIKDLLPFLTGAVIVILMSLSKSVIIDLAAATGLMHYIFLVLAGFLLAIAFILPGISGSFFLLSIGLYETTLTAISDLNIGYLLPFAIGGFLGVIATARVLERLIESKKRGTYLVILGFVIGSLIIIIKDNIPCNMDILYSIIALIIGYFITKTLTRYGGEQA